ncbi:long-chain-fatty-acid--CoA ligase [Segnochrobactraceae bacterium EtOH-i3]
MRGMMMDVPLLTTSVLRHAALNHGDTEIVSRTVEGPIHRYTYKDAWARTQKLANALKKLGLEFGDRVGTLAWNGYRHLELYYGIAGSGMVCHTINPRLFHDQIAFIINNGADRVMFVDLTFVPILEAIVDKVPTLEAIVVMTDEAHMPKSAILPNLLCYETLIAEEPDEFLFPEFDENTAAGMCYTSGTTGDPKGALYSHRSCVLHAMATCWPDVFNISASSTVMPVVPMFHVNAWGMPYSAPIVGAKLVLPGGLMDGASLFELIEGEGVTVTAGVPTVWMNLLDWMAAHGRKFSRLERVMVGGAALPPVMIGRFAALGVDARQAWGMTETSPVGLACALKPKHAALSPDDRIALEAKQGRPLFGMEFRVVNDDLEEVPRDGKSYGSMLVRGPWVAAGYFGLDKSAAHKVPGWFDTGDVVTQDADGFIQIVDRNKDVVKSGGEWISSIELENIAQAHPAVKEAAVVGRADPRWGERPVLVVVLKDGESFSRQEMVAYYTNKVAKWCIPDDVIVVHELPHTATGKLQKMRIREIVHAVDHKLPVE